MSSSGTSVLHHVLPKEALPALANRVVQLQQTGLQPLIITALHPFSRVMEFFGEECEAVDTDNVGFLDCTGATADHRTDLPGDNILFIESPTMLETILARADRLVQRMGKDTAVLVHTLDTFGKYVSKIMVIDFAHQLVNNMRTRSTDVELLCVCDDASEDVVSRMEALVDVTLEGR